MTEAATHKLSLVDDHFLLQKYPGKGGWTYVSIPATKFPQQKSFGITRVSGSINDYRIENTSIWKMKNGDYFLPVKAEIRKKINKQDGDTVHIRLDSDEPLPISDAEIISCFREDPGAFKTYSALTHTQQKKFIAWIQDASREEIKVQRIVTAIDRLTRNKKTPDD